MGGISIHVTYEIWTCLNFLNPDSLLLEWTATRVGELKNLMAGLELGWGRVGRLSQEKVCRFCSQSQSTLELNHFKCRAECV